MAGLQVTDRAPLSAFPLIRTREVGALEDAVARHFGHVRIALPKGAGGFNVITNQCELQSIGLSYARHGAAVKINLPGFGYVGQLFAFKGVAKATASRTEVSISRKQSFVGNVDESILLDYPADFEHIVLKFDSAALVRKLESLSGDPVVGKLRFDSSSTLMRPEAEHLYQAMWFVIDRLNSGMPNLNPLALTEFEQMMMILFMSANSHSHMHLLSGQPAPVAPWQVRRVEEYIEANWDQPITVEALAIVTGTSARSIFHSFKKNRGYTPMEFVKHLRLGHARRMLVDPMSGASVTAVAFACGFGNLGHFASYYHQKFGEQPSDTLRRAKGSKLIASPDKN